LQDSITFGRAVGSAHLQYIEEPTAHAEDISAFFAATGIHVALDESVDEGEGLGSGPRS